MKRQALHFLLLHLYSCVSARARRAASPGRGATAKRGCASCRARLLAAFLLPSVVLAYQEAPMLQKLVRAGELPPVEARLPEEPAVVEPVERIGVYGGTMRTITGSADSLNEASYMMYTPLLRFASDGKTIVPDVARAWELSDDARSITIYLRKGMRWSNGVPVTVDDVLFAWEDVFLNEDLNPRPPAAYRVGNEPMQVERIDDYTFRLVFPQPYGSVPYFLTRSFDYQSLIQPKHYLKKYHPKYRPMSEVMELAKDAGFDHWFELFRDINHTQRTLSSQMPLDYPTLGPWRVQEVPATGNTILERNPYHYRVDTAGNQLPYIDRIHSTYVGTPESRNLMFVTGQIDFGGSFARLENSPLFLSNREKGGYRVYFWVENQGTRVAYYLNQTHRDPELRRLFQDRRFHYALSHAIDRQEINEIVYFGKCQPRQCTVNRTCSYLEPEFETVHAEYDPDKANRILDDLGLVRGRGGWRKLPSGKTLVITLEAIGIEPYMKTSQLVKEYWGAVGVLLNWRVVTGPLIWTRVAGNTYDVVGYPDDVATDIMVLNTTMYGISYWAPLWAQWLSTDGGQGEEPPPHIKYFYEIWEQMRRTPDEAERVRLGKILIRGQADNLWGIGTVGGTISPIIVSRRLHNVPGDGSLWGWPWLATFLHHPEQFFIQE